MRVHMEDTLCFRLTVLDRVYFKVPTDAELAPLKIFFLCDTKFLFFFVFLLNLFGFGGWLDKRFF